MKRSGEIAPEKMKRWSQRKKKKCSVVDVTVMEVKFDTVKNNIASVQFSSVQSLSRVRLFATP